MPMAMAYNAGSCHMQCHRPLNCGKEKNAPLANLWQAEHRMPEARRKVHEHGMTARQHYAQRVKRLSMAALVASSDNPLVTMVPVLSTSIRAGIELML